VLQALAEANVAYVLIGEIAEVMHGSPLMPTVGVITIVPRAGERVRLDSALDLMQASPLSEPSKRAVDAPERWQLAIHGLELVIAPAPAGTQGHDDLRRDHDRSRGEPPRPGRAAVKEPGTNRQVTKTWAAT
jgi:hypothetical protein